MSILRARQRPLDNINNFVWFVCVLFWAVGLGNKRVGLCLKDPPLTKKRGQKKRVPFRPPFETTYPQKRHPDRKLAYQELKASG